MKTINFKTLIQLAIKQEVVRKDNQQALNLRERKQELLDAADIEGRLFEAKKTDHFSIDSVSKIFPEIELPNI